MAAPRTEHGSSTGWAVAKTMLFGAMVAAAIALVLAFSPVQNPGVQDCGTSLGFIVANRPDLRPVPGETPGAADLALQPTCRERVVPQLQRAALAFGAALGLGLLGAAIGLIDDRLAYRRAPRFESLLRERPADAPGRYLRSPPRLGTQGGALPPVERRDVLLLGVLGLGVAGGVVLVVGVDSVGAVFDRIGWSMVVLALLVHGLGLAVAAGQGLLAAEGVLGFRAAVAIALRSVLFSPLLPALGPLGYDLHQLVRRGEERGAALDTCRRRQTLGVLGWFVLMATFGLAARDSPRPGVELEIGWWVLTGALIVFALVGVARLGDRWRRLVVRPGSLRRAFSLSPALRPEAGSALFGYVRLSGQVAGAVALPVASIVCLALVAGAAGGTVSFPILAVIALGVSAIVVLVPTPAGVGAVEAAMPLALVLAGMTAAEAALTVVVWRTTTLWLPLVAAMVIQRRTVAGRRDRSVAGPVLA